MLRGKRVVSGRCTKQSYVRFVARQIAVALSVVCAIGMSQKSAQAQPANNDCSAATSLTTGIPVIGTTVNATGSDVSQLCFDNPDTNDVWFSWTATCTADVTVSTCGSSFDTTLAVYLPPCDINMVDFGCNDDSCGLQSQLIFSATQGTTYLFRVAGVNGATGNYTIVVTCPPIGGCCFGETCFPDQTEDQCLASLGVFLGDGTDCSGTECSFGACCTPSGCSDVMGSIDCMNAGGAYQGGGTTCAGVTCPAFGACCGFNDNSCTELTLNDCNGVGGNYLGDSTTCAVEGLVCATGACCTMSSGCQDLSANDCSLMSGTYYGAGTTCTDFVCNDDCITATVVGAVPYSNQVDNFGANNSPAGHIGSCDGGVTVVAKDVWYRWTPATDCEATASWAPLEGQDNVLIVWVSFSVNPDDDCINAAFQSTPGVPGPNQLDCQECTDGTESCPDPGIAESSTFFAEAGKTYWFQGGQQGSIPDAGGLSEFTLTCSSDTGACCLNEMCFDYFETQCAAAGGLFLGADTDCMTDGATCSTGACCNLDGTCSDGVSENDCLLANGRYYGGATECSTTICEPAGACCTAGVCTVAFYSDCIDGGGQFKGEGTICDANACDGACCSGSSCTIESQTDCVNAGEYFFGPGSTCEEIACPGDGFIQLNYNWNGISNPDERIDVNDLFGYRSIGDRSLILETSDSVGGGTNQVQSGNFLYTFEGRPFVLDTILVGKRGEITPPWDDVIDTDAFGIQPIWDPTDGVGVVDSSTTTLNPPRAVGADFQLGVLSHGTYGGGLYQMTLGFTDASSVNVILHVPDWFANGNGAPNPPSAGVASQALLTPAPLSAGDGFDATEDTDAQLVPAAPLNLVQAVVTRDSILNSFAIDIAGKSLETITFSLWTGSDTRSGGGIYAASIAIPGACCLSDGSCSEGLRSDCVSAGGVYQGDGTDCMTSGGDCVIGACCFTDGSCQDNYTAPQCESESGFFQGSGTMCSTITCPPTGGCCDIGLACSIQFETVCLNSGGAYLGDGTTCDFGCDCNENSVIDVFDLSDSTDCDGNLILDECETPDPSMVGACCVDGFCSLQTPFDCEAAEGVYYGDCTDCNGLTCPGEGYVALDYNWNGILHPGEANAQDDPVGYRSISDRGLIFGNVNSLGGAAGVLTRGNLTYWVNPKGKPSLDIIHVGKRRNAWDATPDGDNIGIQPLWDPSTGTGQTVVSSLSTFPATPALDTNFELGVLYQSGNGGGTVNMTLGFTDATTVTVTIQSPDWYANNNGSPTAPAAGVATQVKLPGPLSAGDGFHGAADNDRASSPDAPLNTIEAVVSYTSLISGLGFDVTGKQLESIMFDNYVGGVDAGCAIIAASYYQPTSQGCTCAGDVSGDNMIDGADIQGFVDCLLGGGGDCSCADVDGMNGADVGDIDDFVTNLLTVGPACP